MECMLCKEECDGTLIVKSADLIDKSGDVVEWKLCGTCFQVWCDRDFERLRKRVKK
jgi:hypothetical protein